MNQTKINGCKTLNEIMQVINEDYDLDAPLGLLAKGVVTTNIPKIIKMIGAKPRTNGVKH